MSNLLLTALNPKWIQAYALADGTWFNGFRCVTDRQDANGILFMCPKCFIAKGHTSKGVHGVICWSPLVPQTVDPKPGRWELAGDTFDTLSLVAGSSSVLLTSGCNAHFFVKHGSIEMC